MVIQVEKKDGVALVTLNRPEAMNALSKAMRVAIAATFADLNDDPDVRCVVLTGAGKAFTAGLDLKELGSDAGALGSANAQEPERNPVAAIERCESPLRTPSAYRGKTAAARAADCRINSK